MANIWDQFVTGLGQQNAPFGFAPPQNGIVQGNPAYGNGMQFIGDMGAGMLANSGRNPMEAFGQAYGQAQEKSRDRSKDAMVMQQMMQQAEQERQKREEERQRKAQLEQYISTLPPEQQALARMFPEKVAGAQIDQQFAPPAGGTEAGLNLTYWTDADNKLHAGQMLKTGGIKEVPLPDGAKWAPGVGYLDTGTGFVPYDKRTGVQEGQPAVSKDLAGAESQKVQGKSQGEAQFNLPAAKSKMESAIKGVEEVLNHDALNSAVGTVQGTELGGAIGGFVNPRVADFRTRVRQLQGGAFLQAYETLKGGGAIANAEGGKAEAAIARLNTAVSEGDFKQALNDYVGAIRRGYAALEAQANGGAASTGAPPESTGNTRYKFNPETGELE